MAFYTDMADAVDHLRAAGEPSPITYMPPGSLAASETAWNAKLEADVCRLRRALRGLDDCFPVLG